ncbi:hypothetical protein FJT64_015279 [Amphibalanus amphitrite]|uniref:RUN and FYVE domain-containing protein 4 n=1 Tax=Amphibalanus amphitrite TaxID=1232801 RepID=A0A6A4X3H6_AMPAM|nr:hypothetical protein FJT64_015279 [Amphibalanus amphitrite]
MSVSHPLLKELKNYVLTLTKDSQERNEILDDHPSMLPFCEVLEKIFREGLLGPVFTPFGATKKDYWSVMESVYQERNSVSSSFHHAVEAVQKSQRVHTQQGRGRLFIRCALFKRCLHVPVESLIRCGRASSLYDRCDSVIGHEILAEICLSLLRQVSLIKFRLNLRNACFLDETWLLPLYRRFEFVPCERLGVKFGFCKSRVLVVDVEPNSVAAEEDNIEPGDIVDELYAECCYGMRRGRVSALLKLYQGMPIYISVVKCHSATGDLYPPAIPLLESLRLDLAQLTAAYQSRAAQRRRLAASADRLDRLPDDPEPADEKAPYCAGAPVTYLGAGFVGNRGDVTVIEMGVENVLRNQPQTQQVQLVLGEMGVTLVDRASGEVVRKHSYTEIASCGRRNDRLRYFAYVAGETSCNMARFFYCHVFEALDEQQAKDVLHGIAEGFRRTHFAV